MNEPTLPRYQDLGRFTVPGGFRGKDIFRVQLWWIVQATIFRFSPKFLYSLRRGLLRMFGAKVGKGVLIRSSATVTYPWKLSIGDHSWVGDECVLYNLADITIGSNAVVSHRSYICTGFHHVDKPAFDIDGSPVVIEDEVWLANDVFVAPGVTIGRGAVVGARSSVFKDMPGGMICFGSPCTPHRNRPRGG